VNDPTFSSTALTESLVPALGELFDRAGSGCFCSYFHFEGDKNAWQARLAFEPEANRQELAERARRTTLSGVVATLPTGAVIGWMKLEPATGLSKLYAQRPYRALPSFDGDRSAVYCVGCFLVDPAYRRRGVARSLLRTGLELAKQRGGRAVEAFPRRADGVRDEELFTGPLTLFTSEGFGIVSEQSQYPVLRHVL
jgi:ribosomal protein S18 acetylase RimI-like enzyme